MFQQCIGFLRHCYFLFFVLNSMFLPWPLSLSNIFCRICCYIKDVYDFFSLHSCLVTKYLFSLNIFQVGESNEKNQTNMAKWMTSFDCYNTNRHLIQFNLYFYTSMYHCFIIEKKDMFASIAGRKMILWWLKWHSTLFILIIVINGFQ